MGQTDYSADILTCTAGHSVPAGNALDTAQGLRCPRPHCGALCGEMRSPADLLPACYVQEMMSVRCPLLTEISQLTWTEIGRRHYVLCLNRGDLTGGEEFCAEAILMTAAPLPPYLRPAEIAAMRYGYEAEQRAFHDPPPEMLFSAHDLTVEDMYTSPECVECGSTDPFREAKPGCRSCQSAASNIIADVERGAGLSYTTQHKAIAPMTGDHR